MMGRSFRSATIDDSSTAVTGLAARLRQATQALHREAERAGLMGRLLRGDIDRADYAALLTNLLALYEALEQGLAQQAGDDRFAAFGFAELRRAPALRSDLAALAEPAAPLQPAMRACVERLQSIAAHEPTLLIAHAYVRYLGDLNGGQVLRRVVAGSLALDDGALRFHDFGNAADAALRAARFRAALDALAIGDAAADALVGEARWSFAQHVLLFDGLHAASPPKPRMRL